jgi:hypothetical protein
MHAPIHRGDTRSTGRLPWRRPRCRAFQTADSDIELIGDIAWPTSCSTIRTVLEAVGAYLACRMAPSMSAVRSPIDVVPPRGRARGATRDFRRHPGYGCRIGGHEEALSP